MKGLGLKIKKEREEIGLSQAEVAREIPMNQSNYSKIERDMQDPSPDQLKRLCEILKLDANYLLEVEDYSGISVRDLELLRDIKNLIKKYK